MELVRAKGLFSFYEDGHGECCRVRKVRLRCARCGGGGGGGELALRPAQGEQLQRGAERLNWGAVYWGWLDAQLNSRHPHCTDTAQPPFSYHSTPPHLPRSAPSAASSPASRPGSPASARTSPPARAWRCPQFRWVEKGGSHTLSFFFLVLRGSRPGSPASARTSYPPTHPPSCIQVDPVFEGLDGLSPPLSSFLPTSPPPLPPPSPRWTLCLRGWTAALALWSSTTPSPTSRRQRSGTSCA